MEDSRTQVARSVGARDRREVMFASSAYAAASVLAHSFGSTLKKGDQVLLSAMESDHMVIPWRVAARKWGFKLKVFRPDMTEGGEFAFGEFAGMVSGKTRLIVFQHACPVFGSFNPLNEFMEFATGCGIPVAVDATHSLPWGKVNVQQLRCDFLLVDCGAIGAPRGSTFLYGRMERLQRLPPVLGGEDTFEQFYMGKLKVKLARDVSNWASVPERFEVGLPPLAVGTAVATALREHERNMDSDLIARGEQLGAKLYLELSSNPRLKVYGNAMTLRIPCATFTVDDADEAALAEQLRKHNTFIDVGSHGSRVAHKEELQVESSLRVCLDPRIHTLEDVSKFCHVVEIALKELDG